MKRFTLTILLVLILSTINFAQAPDTLWTRTYGGSNEDLGYDVQQTLDGGYIILGQTQSYGNGWTDVYLVKTDPEGNEEWYQTFGDANYNVGRSVLETADSCFIIAGTSDHSGTARDVYLIKTDLNGNDLWERFIGGNSTEVGNSISHTADGGYIITGVTWSYGAGASNVYLLKVNSNGNETWHRAFGGDEYDEGWDVQQTTDGGYIIVGWTNSYGIGSGSVYIIKTNSNGIEEWYQTFGESNNDYGYCVQQTTDGGYIIVGRTESSSTGIDVYLIKTDTLGNEEWSQTFNGGGMFADHGEFVQQTTDGGYIIAGDTQAYSGWSNVYLIKTDANGNEIWNSSIGGENHDYGMSVKQTEDEGYIVAGYTESYGAGSNDFYLLKIAPDILILVEPASCNFETVEIGYPSSTQILVINEGYSELTISEFILSPPFSSQIISGDSSLSYNDTTIVEITFDPQVFGYFIDSLGIVSNAFNEDTVWVYLEGEGGIVPAPVSGLTIELAGNDAVLNWSPVDTSIHGTPITVDAYLIYYSELPYNPDSLFFFHGLTSETTYSHEHVAQFSVNMFYWVEAYIGEIETLDALLAKGEAVTREEVWEAVHH